MPNVNDRYNNLVKTLREISTLDSAASLLSWDEQTFMPKKGAELRANQASLLARMSHEKFTDPWIGEILREVEGSELTKEKYSDSAVNIRWTRRLYDRATKVPPKLVEEMSHTAVLAHEAWVGARKKADYKEFEPWLAKTLDLKKREAECVGYKGHIYNALLDPFEPDETAENLTQVFAALRGPLVELIGKIASSGRKAPVEILERKFPSALQEKLSREAAGKIGFDFEAGRLDVSVHPFCSGLGPGDCRMTTRYDENYFGDAFFGVLHETGHGLYNQGLEGEHWGTPRGESISLGIHESQSRMWENLVGRSAAFWRFYFPKAKEAFGDTLRDVSEEQWVFAVNDVRPSLIRTEADEATYNLHILLRFELEQAMLSGDLSVADIPGAWNEKMKKYLGLTPGDDSKGCLQDVHWSSGAIGYFPTYTLGNLYAAQFFQQARKDLGDLDGQFASGEFSNLLNWLRQNIHRHGRRYSARELVKRVTGRDLSWEPLMEHLTAKARQLYGITT